MSTIRRLALAAAGHYHAAMTVCEGPIVTCDTAWLGFDEKERGTLEPGKAADMVLLDRNPLEVDRRDLGAVKVRQLLLAGRPYRPGQGRLDLLARGVFSHGKI